jgi:chromate transporter
MQRDLVTNKKWINESDFHGAFSLIKAMPGPVAFMTAVFLGRHRGGLLGGFLAAIALVTPSAFLMVLFSYFFKSLMHLSSTEMIMLGMQLCALGVILGSLKGMIKNNNKNIYFWLLIIISGIINFFFPSLEPLIILMMGLLIILYKRLFFVAKKLDLSVLFLVCFKAGALVFGSGLAIVPMLKHDVVTVNHWLTEGEFINALAFGQMTPGPVVITATFIGHHIHGGVGALVATIAIFLASFIHMMTWFPLVIKKLSGKAWVNDFVFGAVAAVVGPIIVTVLKLYWTISFSYLNLFFLLAAFLITISNKIPLWIIIPGGGFLYYFFKLLI